MTIGGSKNHTITLKIRKLLYRFSSGLLDYFRFEGPPPLYSLVSDLILKANQGKGRKSYYKL